GDGRPRGGGCRRCASASWSPSETICIVAQIAKRRMVPMPDVRASSVPTDEHAQLAVETFRMLADPTRVKILWLLLHDEHNVSALCQEVGASAPAVSQHLAKLRLAGLVT